MRIKLRCPHCGDWFTLSLGVENGEAESRDSDEQAEEADADEEPARPRSKASRGRLIGAVTVVAAAVIVVWAVAALRGSREGAVGAPGDVSARPAAAEVASEPEELIGSEASGAASSEPDVSTGQPLEGETASPDRETTGPADNADGGRGRPGDDSGGDGDLEAASAAEGGPAAGRSAEHPSVAGVVAVEHRPSESAAERDDAAAPRAVDREILELEVEALDRCWIRVEADGVVVADATLEAGERRRWRADGFFELDLGAGDAVRLFLNGNDLGPAGPNARVVEGLRVTREGIRGR